MIENYCFTHAYPVALLRRPVVFARGARQSRCRFAKPAAFLYRAAVINQRETKWAIYNAPFRRSSPSIMERRRGAGELGTGPKISWRIGSKEHNCNHF